MKVRIRKAGPGETPGYKSKLNKFIPKAENGGEATAMITQLVKAAYNVLIKDQAEPEELYNNLLAQKIEPQIAMEIIRRAVALSEENEDSRMQENAVNDEIEQEEKGTKDAIAEEAAKQAEWENLKLHNQEETDQLFMQDQEDYNNSQAQNEAIDEDYDQESEDQFNNMMFSEEGEPSQYAKGGVSGSPGDLEELLQELDRRLANKEITEKQYRYLKDKVNEYYSIKSDVGKLQEQLLANKLSEDEFTNKYNAYRTAYKQKYNESFVCDPNIENCPKDQELEKLYPSAANEKVLIGNNEVTKYNDKGEIVTTIEPVYTYVNKKSEPENPVIENKQEEVQYEMPVVQSNKSELPILNYFAPIHDRTHIPFNNPFTPGRDRPINWAPYSAALRAFTGYKKGDEQKYYDEIKQAREEDRPVNLENMPLMGKTDLKARRKYKKALKNYYQSLEQEPNEYTQEEKYGGLTRAQFGYDVVNQRENETPELTNDQLIGNVFKMFKGRENEIPNEVDRLIAETPGIQKLHFPGIEEYIPQYSPLSVYDSYQVPNPFDAVSEMKRGGMTKKSFVKQMMKKYAEGGQEENVDEGGDEEEKTTQPTPMDTANGDVEKMKNGFIDSIKMAAKEKVFADFWDNAPPEIKNVEFMNQKPMAQNGYMVPENDFTHYTHGTDDIFNQQMNEYITQFGGFVDPNKPDLNKFVYGGPDYMDKNTADPYSRAEFQGYGKYGVSVGNIKMARRGMDLNDKNLDDPIDDEQKRKLAESKAADEWNILKNQLPDGSGTLVNYAPDLKDPAYIEILNRYLKEQGLPILENNNTKEWFNIDDPNVIREHEKGWGQNLDKGAYTDPYDIITPERINYQFVPTSGGRIGLMDALLPWNPFRSYQSYSYQVPLSDLMHMQNLKLGNEQYPWYSIRNLDNIPMPGSRRAMNKLLKQLQNYTSNQNEGSIYGQDNRSLNDKVKEYFGESDASWKKLKARDKKILKNGYLDLMEREQGPYAPDEDIDNENININAEQINNPILEGANEYVQNEWGDILTDIVDVLGDDAATDFNNLLQTNPSQEQIDAKIQELLAKRNAVIQRNENPFFNANSSEQDLNKNQSNNSETIQYTDDSNALYDMMINNPDIVNDPAVQKVYLDELGYSEDDWNKAKAKYLSQNKKAGGPIYGNQSFIPSYSVMPTYDLGGESQKCPPGYKKDPVSGMCRDDMGNTTYPTFIPSTTSNFTNFKKENKDVTSLLKNPFPQEPLDAFNNKYNQVGEYKFDSGFEPEDSDYDPNQLINISGRLKTTDYESGINQLQAGKYALANIIGNWGRNNRENQMLMDNANIMNLASRTPMLDMGDHGELGSGYGQFRTYGAEQQSRTAYGKTGGTFKRGGSKIEYNVGDELYMTEAEIADFVKKGGKLEFV